MIKERKILAWLAVVGSLVICCPCALCSGYEAFSCFAAALSPEMLTPFVPEGMVVTPEYLTSLAVGFGFVGLVVVVAGVVGLVWGVRALLSGRTAQGEAKTG